LDLEATLKTWREKLSSLSSLGKVNFGLSLGLEKSGVESLLRILNVLKVVIVHQHQQSNLGNKIEADQMLNHSKLQACLQTPRYNYLNTTALHSPSKTAPNYVKFWGNSSLNNNSASYVNTDPNLYSDDDSHMTDITGMLYHSLAMSNRIHDNNNKNKAHMDDNNSNANAISNNNANGHNTFTKKLGAGSGLAVVIRPDGHVAALRSWTLPREAPPSSPSNSLTDVTDVVSSDPLVKDLFEILIESARSMGM